MPDRLLAFAGPFPECPHRKTACSSQPLPVVFASTKPYYKALLYKQRGAGFARLLLKHFGTTGVRQPAGTGCPFFRFDRIGNIHAEEKDGSRRISHRSVSCPAGRRGHADRSPPQATGRRSTGERSSTDFVASESHGEFDVTRDTTSRPAPRPPIHGRHAGPS